MVYKPYNIDRLKGDLTRDEGSRAKPYLDTVGKTTIGVGHNLDDRPLTASQIDMILMDDIDQAEKDLDAINPRWRLQTDERQLVLLNMAFNLGRGRLAGFLKMWAAITGSRYNDAADEMLDSKWARQVGARAERLATRMRNG